jgi:hypothetical protein
VNNESFVNIFISFICFYNVPDDDDEKNLYRCQNMKRNGSERKEKEKEKN